VALSVSVVANSSPTQLAFTVTNNGERPFRTTLLGTESNHAVLVLSSGKTVEAFTPQKVAQSFVEVAPSQSRTWQMSLPELLAFGDTQLKAFGKVRIYWKVQCLESHSIYLQINL
jgi:hypothetical protein